MYCHTYMGAIILHFVCLSFSYGFTTLLFMLSTIFVSAVIVCPDIDWMGIGCGMEGISRYNDR